MSTSYWTANHCPTCGHGAEAFVGLTRMQAAVFAYVADYIDTHGYPPSFEEIAARFEYATLATVHEHISNLVAKGWLTRRFREARSIALTPEAAATRNAQSMDSVSAPLPDTPRE